VSNEAHRWKPGQSGNPSGRRPGYVKLALALSSQTDDGMEVVRFALAVMRGETVEPPSGKAKKPRKKKWSERSRIWAAEWLADRLWGKPRQVVELETSAPKVETNYDALDERDLAELDRIMTKAIVAPMVEHDINVPDDAIPAESADVPKE